jgi:transposase
LVAKRVKKKEGEKLTPDNIQKVINLLEQGKPITKKEACEILNITYNTTRLGNIIEGHKAQLTLDAKRRAANRGKPASHHEIKDIIEWYLEGDSMSDIADRLYRSVAFVKDIVTKVGVPQRGAGQNYMSFEPLPEQCISDSFNPGDLVWSSKYLAVAEVLKEKGTSSDGLSKLYHIYVLEKIEDHSPYFTPREVGGFYANQPAYDLGKLEHLREYGVNVKKALAASNTRQSSDD